MNDASNSTPQPQSADEQPRFLADHFDSPQQQLASGKLGMWIFLLTEILLFGGLFCAYAVYRSAHPEVFREGAKFLSKNLGAVNTCVLIFSSLTMAWAVHCAQRSQRRGLIICLVLTLFCACGFLGIKYVEYKSKWEHGLLPGKYYQPLETQTDDNTIGAEPEQQYRRHSGPSRNIRIFFTVYFLMTGLHAIHVIAGMGVISWILVRAVKRHFDSQYFGPVDFVGLYWHLVDMIWIFLFPLLYLIH